METITRSDIFNISNNVDFEKLAMRIFHYQYANCEIYRQYVNRVAKDVTAIQTIRQIPFLPIDFFKHHRIVSGSFSDEIVFTSSGTTGMQCSTHHVVKVSLYQESFVKAFNSFVGNPEEFAILSLLPSYAERKGSSLLYMMEYLTQLSKHPKSGFYLYNKEDLVSNLQLLVASKQKTILWGVSYALLDLIETNTFSMPEILVFETGGMKGRRKEMLREDLHTRLKQGFGVSKIYSEYGMTELLSQAYSIGNQCFNTPPWMKVFIRDAYNPLHVFTSTGVSGGINVIDLANLYSCSFIATQDIGILHNDNSFEVLGRFDNSDIRGCNLLIH